MPLQDRVDQLRQGRFLGVQFDDFERAGREQLIFMLMHGLTPQAKVLDIGCGVLRAGYWLIHFLEPDSYCGIEPSAERLAIGTDSILEPHIRDAKHPRFDTNANFDTSVFREKFDFFLAYSIWTHASKRHIEVMLDGFVRDAKDDGVFLASFLPAAPGEPDYLGDEWVGTSHESRTPGCIHHSFDWIAEQCRRRGLSVRVLGKDATIGQTWLRIGRAGRGPRIADLTLQAPPVPLLTRIKTRARIIARRLLARRA